MKTTSRKNLGIAREKTEYRYSVNFTATENAQCLNLFELSGVYSKSRFIKARVFDESFRVIKIDRTLVDYYQKLSALFGQFRAIGVNYNQITVAMKSNFTEKKGRGFARQTRKTDHRAGGCEWRNRATHQRIPRKIKAKVSQANQL